LNQIILSEYIASLSGQAKSIFATENIDSLVPAKEETVTVKMSVLAS
jgi:hypothetical protein